MLSRINNAATRALVFISDATGKSNPDLIVRKSKGQWEATPYLGGAPVLVSPAETKGRKIHPQSGKEYGEIVQCDVPLGVFLKELREKLGLQSAPAE